MGEAALERWRRYRAVTAGEALPCALIDLDAFEANTRALAAPLRGTGKTLRVATSRSVARARAAHPRPAGPLARGLMTYTAAETAFWVATRRAQSPPRVPGGAKARRLAAGARQRDRCGRRRGGRRRGAPGASRARGPRGEHAYPGGARSGRLAEAAGLGAPRRGASEPAAGAARRGGAGTARRGHGGPAVPRRHGRRGANRRARGLEPSRARDEGRVGARRAAGALRGGPGAARGGPHADSVQRRGHRLAGGRARARRASPR